MGYIRKVKQRRLNNPNHVRQLLAEQINILRNDDELDPLLKARAIGYLANILLSAYKDGELLERVKSVEEMLKEQQGVDYG